MFAIVAFTTVAAGYRWQQEVTLTFHAQQFCSLAAAAAAFAVLVLRVSGLQVCGVFCAMWQGGCRTRCSRLSLSQFAFWVLLLLDGISPKLAFCFTFRRG